VSDAKLKRIPIGFIGGIKLSFQRLLPFLKCCRTRRDNLSHAADDAMKEELKIVYWVQFYRKIKLAMKKLFTEE